MNVKFIENSVNLTLFLIILYSIYMLYIYFDDIQTVLMQRVKNKDFMISIVLFIIVIILYFYLKHITFNMDEDKLSSIDKKNLKKLKRKLKNFKQAINSGFSAIIIAVFAISGALMPQFFLTLITTYHSNMLF